MLESDWRKFARIGLVVLFALCAAMIVGVLIDHSQRNAERSEASRYGRDYAEAEQQCLAMGVRRSPQLIDCMIQEADALYAQKHDQADLHAQQDVAAWTGGLFWIGMFTCVTGVVGIFLLIENISMLQADAAQRANDFKTQLDHSKRTDDMQRRQEGARPYPYVELSLTHEETLEGPRVIADASVSLENIGRSSCDVLHYKVWIRGERTNGSPAHFNIVNTWVPFALRANAKSVQPTTPKTDLLFDGFTKEQVEGTSSQYLLLIIELRHRDVYDISWDTQFIWQWRGKDGLHAKPHKPSIRVESDTPQ